MALGTDWLREANALMKDSGKALVWWKYHEKRKHKKKKKSTRHNTRPGCDGNCFISGRRTFGGWHHGDLSCCYLSSLGSPASTSLLFFSFTFDGSGCTLSGYGSLLCGDDSTALSEINQKAFLDMLGPACCRVRRKRREMFVTRWLCNVPYPWPRQALGVGACASSSLGWRRSTCPRYACIP